MAKEKLYKNSKGEYIYTFNWIGGGWNDVWAPNKKEALKRVKEKFGGLEVNKSTLRKRTKSGWDKWCRDSYLATC